MTASLVDHARAPCTHPDPMIGIADIGRIPSGSPPCHVEEPRNMNDRLLVVEDDTAIGETLTSSLRGQGHEVVWERTGQAGLTSAATNDFDLVLLDLGLPDLDEVEVCRRLRRQQVGAVVVVVTARTMEMDVATSLEAGADDYLIKPIRLVELHARIRAHLRRGPDHHGQHDPHTGRPGRRLRRPADDGGGRRGRSAAARVRSAARLAAEPSVAISRTSLMSDVWDEHWYGSTKTLDVHVAVVRRKLGAARRHRGIPSGDRDRPRTRLPPRTLHRQVKCLPASSASE